MNTKIIQQAMYLILGFLSNEGQFYEIYCQNRGKYIAFEFVRFTKILCVQFLLPPATTGQMTTD